MTSIYDYYDYLQREQQITKALLERHEQNVNSGAGYLSSQQRAAPLIEQALRKLNNPEGWRSLVETARRFPVQSPENQLLIASHSTRLTRGRQPGGSLAVVRNVPLFLVTAEEAVKRAGNSAGQQVKVIGTNGSVVSMVRNGGVKQKQWQLFSNLFASSAAGLTKNTLNRRMRETIQRQGFKLRQLTTRSMRSLDFGKKQKVETRGYFFQRDPRSGDPVLIFGPGVDVDTNSAALSHALAIGTWLRVAEHVPVQNLQPMGGFIAEGLRHAITNIALDTQNSERVYKPSPFKINSQQWPRQLNINEFYTAHILTTSAIKEALRSISYHKSRIDKPWAGTGMDAELSKQYDALQRIVDTADYSLTQDSPAIRANGGVYAAKEDMAIPAQLREQAISDASYEVEH